MGERTRSIGVRAMVGAFVLAGATGCGGTTPAQAPPAAAPTTTASAAATTEAAATGAPAAGRALAQVFPNVDDATCVPSGGDVRTGTGAVPTEAYTCDYSSVAPNATVIFAQWPDQTAAQAWYQDTVDLGARVENFDKWQVGGVDEGPLYTARNANDVVISTGVYENLPYTWEIRTATLDESNTIFNQLQLKGAAGIG
ncbi:hypothetical protein [Pseudonocardia abyssalis]|uniref:DUF3558 domain-containing protein n=1 Tax=Pseudonocardia abyssalis TaxID=2792008 RepID=A0ABS6UXR8_9PSEU|nr:hypothetical protein [Pseudonocardia abyssalis]MBW0116644.1 hypothetical protein [Pseudonocardia abyssalis]MBW0136499.1 hypothetical protein [Pseudonocardia abyssalis]